MASIRECYAEGASFNEAFARWLNRLFPDDGLVFMSGESSCTEEVALSPLPARDHGIPGILTDRHRTERGAGKDLPCSGEAEVDQPVPLPQGRAGTPSNRARTTSVFAAHGISSPRGTRADRARNTGAAESERHPAPTRAGHASADGCVCRRARQRSPITHRSRRCTLTSGSRSRYSIPRASATIVEERVRRVLEKYSLEIQELYGDPRF